MKRYEQEHQRSEESIGLFARGRAWLIVLCLCAVGAWCWAGEAEAPLSFTVSSSMADGSAEPRYMFQEATLAETFAKRLSVREGFAAMVVQARDWRQAPEGVDPTMHVSLVHAHLGARRDFLAFVLGGPQGSIRFAARAPALDQRQPLYWFTVPTGDRQIERNAPIDLIAHFANQYRATPDATRPVVTLRLVAWQQEGADLPLSVAAEFVHILPVVAASAWAAGLQPTFAEASDRLTVEVARHPATFDIRASLSLDGESRMLVRRNVSLDDLYDTTHLLFSLLRKGDGMVLDFARVADGEVTPTAVVGSGENSIVTFREPEAFRARHPVTGNVVWELVKPEAERSRWAFASRREAAGIVRLYGGRGGLVQSIAPVDGRATALPAVPASVFSMDEKDDWYVLADRHKLRCFRAGELRWEIATERAITAGPVLSEFCAIYVEAGGHVVARTLADGAELWRLVLAEPPNQRLVCLEGRVLITTQSGTLHAFNAQDGKPLWSREIGDALVQDPQEVDGALLVVSGANRLFVLDPGTGDLLSERSWPTWLLAASVVGSATDRRVVCLDQRNRVTFLSWPGLEPERALTLPHRLTPAVLECPALPLPWGARRDADDLMALPAESRHVVLVGDVKGYIFMFGLED